MASLQERFRTRVDSKTGKTSKVRSWVIQYRIDHERRSIYLGDMSKAEAGEHFGHVKKLVHAKRVNGIPPENTVNWLKSIDKTYRTKLVRVGLIDPLPCDVVQGAEPEAERPVTIGEYVDRFIKQKEAEGLAVNTIENFEQVRRLLREYVGDDVPIADISADHMRIFRSKLDDRFAIATVSKHVKRARQIFENALENDIIQRNPMRKIKAGTEVNEDRKFYVPRELVQKIIKACPDCEWRLIFVLSRYAGLRVPSELALLTWDDVDWENNVLNVNCVKTRRSKPFRKVPIFPEVRLYLDEAWEQAKDGATWVIPWLDGNTDRSPRTQAVRIIEKKAKLKVWPKLFQNMRASCETDLEKHFGLHVVTGWLGNSPKVATKHYLQTTPEDVQRAISMPTGDMPETVSGFVAKSNDIVAKNVLPKVTTPQGVTRRQSSEKVSISQGKTSILSGRDDFRRLEAEANQYPNGDSNTLVNHGLSGFQAEFVAIGNDICQENGHASASLPVLAQAWHLLDDADRSAIIAAGWHSLPRDLFDAILGRIDAALRAQVAQPEEVRHARR